MMDAAARRVSLLVLLWVFAQLVRYNSNIVMISKTDNPQRLSKHRTDLELPKVRLPGNRQISKQNSLENITFEMRYEWVNRPSEYLLLTDSEVQQQHAYLLSELASLQEESRKLTETGSRVITKPLHRSRQANVAQHREREIENNNYTIWKLKNECDQLQRQASPTPKEGIEAKILDVRDKIAKTKQKIKELKHKSKVMGDSLQNGHDYFEQYKRLEHEREGVQARKLKLQEKARANTARLERLMNNLTDIEGDVLYAETYLEECHQNQKNEAAERTLEGEHRQKSYQIEIIRKTIESQKSVKQQKYHTMLKTYEAEAEKMENLSQRLQNTEIKNLYQKKQIMELEQILGGLEAALEEKSRTTGSVEPTMRHPEHLLELRDQRIYRNKQPPKINLPKPNRISRSRERKMQSSSRTRTTGNYTDPKANRTQVLSKPPSQTDYEQSTMITQPIVANRGYFRNRKIVDGRSDRNARTAMEGGQKSVDFIPVQIREEIHQQSPEKETVSGNTIEQKEIFDRVNTAEQRSKKIQKDGKDKIQAQRGQIEQSVKVPVPRQQITTVQKREVEEDVENAPQCDKSPSSGHNEEPENEVNAVEKQTIQVGKEQKEQPIMKASEKIGSNQEEMSSPGGNESL